MRVSRKNSQVAEYENQVGKLLRKWRKYLGYSQSYLGMVSKMDPRVIQNVELGKRCLTVGELALICDALQIPAEGLVPTTWQPRLTAIDGPGPDAQEPERKTTQPARPADGPQPDPFATANATAG
jgi:transcriptional regulator with XRE-family HTH domain